MPGYKKRHSQRKVLSHICYEWFDEDMQPHSIILHAADSFERLYPWVKRRFTTFISWDGEDWRLISGERLSLPYKAKV